MQRVLCCITPTGRFSCPAVRAWHHAATAGAKAVAGGRVLKVNLWYRRKAKARQEAALAVELSRQRDILSRAEAFTRQLQAELAEAGRLHKIVQGIIGELRI